MKKYCIILLTLLCLAGVGGACREPDPWKDIEWRKEWFKKHIKTRYEINDASPDMVRAVEKYVSAFLSNPNSGEHERYILSEKEYAEIYWANLPEKWTGGTHLEPWDGWVIEQDRRPLGIKRLRHQLAKGPVEVLDFTFRRPPEQYNAVMIHFPGFVRMRDSNGKVLETDLVRAILEHRGQFKIVLFGPN